MRPSRVCQAHLSAPIVGYLLALKRVGLQMHFDAGTIYPHQIIKTTQLTSLDNLLRAKPFPIVVSILYISCNICSGRDQSHRIKYVVKCKCV